jgi:polyisoprenoid-binding protein YceI
MRKFLAAMAAIAALTGACGQNGGAAPAEAAAPAMTQPAGGWTIDKAKSRIEFSGTQTGKEFKGAFGTFDAAIVFDLADLSGARVDVSVDTASAKTGDKQRDDALPGGDWFSAKAFPTATFSSSEVVATGEGAYEARGTLTIRGVARDLVLPFTLSIDGGRAVADGSATLVRTDFGVGQGEFATGQWVGLDVAVAFHIEASR